MKIGEINSELSTKSTPLISINKYINKQKGVNL